MDFKKKKKKQLIAHCEETLVEIIHYYVIWISFQMSLPGRVDNRLQAVRGDNHLMLTHSYQHPVLLASIAVVVPHDAAFRSGKGPH